MDIIVKGEAYSYFKPEEVTLNLTFKAKNEKYDTVLEEGVKSVEIFVSEVLNIIGLTKESMKTNSFRIQEGYRYEQDKNDNRKSVFDGYNYNQLAKVKFDYDIQKMTKFMELVSQLKTPPSYVINFNVKDDDSCRNEVLKLAFQKAKSKAGAIASATGMTLTKCLKTDFKPFEEELISNSRINTEDFAMRGASKMKESSISNVLQKIFTPEDVLIKETLYCLWLAE